MNLGKLLAAAARKAAPYIVPVVVAVVTKKVGKLGDKLVTKASRPRA